MKKRLLSVLLLLAVSLPVVVSESAWALCADEPDAPGCAFPDLSGGGGSAGGGSGAVDAGGEIVDTAGACRRSSDVFLGNDFRQFQVLGTNGQLRTCFILSTKCEACSWKLVKVPDNFWKWDLVCTGTYTFQRQNTCQ